MTTLSALHAFRRQLRAARNELVRELRGHPTLRQRVREIDALTDQLVECIDDCVFETQQQEMAL